MKNQITQKFIRQNYKTFKVGYCDLQDLLRAKNPQYCTCGVYGWNSDIYIFGDIAISTGYRPFGAKINAEIVKDFNEKARRIWQNYELDYTKQSEKVNNLLDEFLKTL